MSGICGEVSFQTLAAPPSPDVVEVMANRMASRGPDAEGIVTHDGAIFGHRRLSVIDLTEKSGQPMIDKRLKLGIVYNGEIYNYRQLRSELEQRGHKFFSQGDTEVLLKAYHTWGEEFVHRLNGMFAFTIWDQQSGRLVMGRDRLGIKPLYYDIDDYKLRFASTLPALIAAGDIDTSINPVALHYYMTFHAVVPAPHTILNGVKKLPPATLMIVERDGTHRQHTYWQPSFNPREEDANLTEQDWRDRVLQALRASVQRRLVADVPVGALLSGGLDSSLIVALLAENGQTDLNTFSIGFESVGQEQGNEFKYSDLIAERFGTTHHKVELDTQRVLASLDQCVREMSEPMVSHDAIGFYLLSQEVAKHVKVVQSGQGADEIFGGYHWYPPLLDSANPTEDYARGFFDRDHEEYARAVNERFIKENYSRAFIDQHFAMPGADRGIDKALRLDTTIMLVDDPAKRVDNMTMAWGLEARLPFLDHELVELAARIPAELKVAGGGKGILKQTARNILPDEVIDRPKGYFPVPALKYLRGEYLEKVRDVLNQPAAKERDLFNTDYVNTLLASPEEHITPLQGSKLWQIALLESWLQIQGA